MPSSSEQPLSRAQQRERTRQRILTIAARHFATHGFDAASIGNIAAAAGVKKALVQYHFETKENLWKAAIDFLWEKRTASMSQIIAPYPEVLDRAAMKRVLQSIVRGADQHREWFVIMFREAASPGPRFEWLLEHHLRADYEEGVNFVLACQRSGLLPALSPMHLIQIISGALAYPLFITRMIQEITGEPLDPGQLDAYVETLLQLLTRSP